MACIKVSSQGEDGTFRVIPDSETFIHFNRYFHYNNILTVLLQRNVAGDLDKDENDLNPRILPGLQIVKAELTIAAKGFTVEPCFLLIPTLDLESNGSPVSFSFSEGMYLGISCLPVREWQGVYSLKNI
ncbi:MAG: hypothetical protein AAFR66_10695 [Bacteroidota bacterium]